MVRPQPKAAAWTNGCRISDGVAYKLYDNSTELLKATAKQVEAALEAVGQQAEGDIKDEITERK